MLTKKHLASYVVGTILIIYSWDSKLFPSSLLLPPRGLKLLRMFLALILRILLPNEISWISCAKSYWSGWTSTECVERWKFPGTLFTWGKNKSTFFPKYFHFSILSLGSNLIIQTEESHIINGIKSHIKVIWFFREL